MNGQLRKVEIYRELASPASNQPPDTESIVEDYWDDAAQRKVATAHYFWLPAYLPPRTPRWRIGGSLVPEGKMVYWDGSVLYCHH